MSKPTERFSDRAEAYAAYRPSYPDGARDSVFSSLGDPHALIVADIEVRTEWRDGTGEATGLPSQSVDVATAFQAFHWFATAAAGMRLFAAFSDARVTRSEFSFHQTLDLDGLLGRAASSSYLPQSGDAHKAMQAEIRDAFARFEKQRQVSFAMTTFVIIADF